MMKVFGSIAIVCLVLWSGLLLKSQPQHQEVHIKGSEVFLRTPSGDIRQLTRDGKPKFHVRLSPDGRWVVYHGDKGLRDGVEQYTLTLLPLGDRKEAEQMITTEGIGEIEDLEWLSNDLFGVLGAEGRGTYDYTIFDAGTGTLRKRLGGYKFSTSPNKSRLAFLEHRAVEFTESSVPVTWTDEIMLYRIREVWAGSEQYVKGSVIYPMPGNSPLAGESEHSVLSKLVWSPKNASLAFVEEHQKANWAVVLDLEQRERSEVSQVRRFKLLPKGKLQYLDAKSVSEERVGKVGPGGPTKVRLPEVDSVVWEQEERLIVTGTLGLWDATHEMEYHGPKMEWRIDLKTGEIEVRTISEPENENAIKLWRAIQRQIQ
jgi:hypothetical protein